MLPNPDFIMPEQRIGPLPFDQLTKIEGDPIRHIEQLWDEVKIIREKLDRIERGMRYLCKEKNDPST